MALSSLSAGLLGAASGVNSMLRGQIRGEMMRQQEAMQRGEQGMKEQQLMLQRDQLSSLRKQQRDALELEYRQLEETIRANKEKAALQAADQQNAWDIAALKEAGSKEGEFTEAKAIQMEYETRKSSYDNFMGDITNYDLDPVTKTPIGMKQTALKTRDALMRGMDPEDIQRTGREKFSNAKRPRTASLDIGGNFKLLPRAKDAWMTVEQAGVKPQDLINTLLDPKGFAVWNQRYGLTSEELQNLFMYATQKLNGQ
jgi:hypothetical protein